MQLRFALGVLAVLAAASTSAEIHKWVDAQGNVHFSDRVPANAQSQVVKVKPNVYTAPTVEKRKSPIAASQSVVLYSASWCGYCKRARQYFLAKRIPFAEYDVETSPKGRDDFVRLGMRGVPVILVGSNRLNGFSRKTFDQLYASRER